MKIYGTEYKVPKGKIWRLWGNGLFSLDKKEVERTSEKWWGTLGYGRMGYRYRIVTFKRIKA